MNTKLKSPCSSPVTPPSSSSSTSNLAMRTQKKILSKLSTKGVVKHLVDDQITQSIENLHQILLVVYPIDTSNKVGRGTRAQIISICFLQIIKNILKVTVKLGMLSKENVLSAQHRATLTSLESQFRALTLTILSFQTVGGNFYWVVRAN